MYFLSGHYCTGGALTDSPSDEPTKDSKGIYTGNGLCPKGHYCPKGTTQPEPCDKGTWSDQLELQSRDQCRKCSAGKYCDEVGAVDNTVSGCIALCVLL